VTDLISKARAFLAGKALTFEEANKLWKELKNADEISLARRVLERLRDGKGLVDDLPGERKIREKLCQQEALLTSKDAELSTTVRHDRALRILRKEFGNLDDRALDGDAETLGIAGGILKRRWGDLGQIEDARQAAKFYERGAGEDLGEDGYTHINAAFMEDVLAHIGDDPAVRKEKATRLRERILEDLPSVEKVSSDGAWFNTATRAEALFGLRRYAEATQAIVSFKNKPAPWELETTSRQLATLACLQQPNPLGVAEIRAFFEALLPGAADASRSALAGKVGLALSGGGFRASFYHLGVLARLAELNVLRHVEVLSCVSGGSIVGACYWLALRRRMLKTSPLTRVDYLALVKEVIRHFLDAVATNLRVGVQPSRAGVAWRFLSGEKGALDPEQTALALEEHFYRPLFSGEGRPFTHELPFTPADHNPDLAGSKEFHPGKHNWLRAHKVPVLVLNATTVNTGHAWQFTPTWMGESPWAVHEAADSIPRLEWSWYEPKAGWKMELGRAVAASACVPGVFAPLEIDEAYKDVKVRLVDGGVHDNQGTVSLLALNCNVLLVSDACGQLLLEEHPKPGLKGLLAYAQRSMDTLMERVRLANWGDLAARQRTGLLRGFMFLHMKAGLDADTIRLPFSQESYELTREKLSPSGVRKDFQQALAELRTDLDAFTPDESHALMACGYQMASWAFERDLASLVELWEKPVLEEWPFKAMLQEITSTAATTARRDELLAALRAGSKVQV
jgi:predicted acylesterase/phospholipase RssA